MEQVDVLAEVAARLEALGVTWMLVGSHAATIHGHYRSTHDIDIVIAYGPADVSALVAAFDGDYYVDAQMLTEGLKLGMMSNIIHYETAEKVDLWPLRDEPYDRTALERRVRVAYGETLVWAASAEDTVLSKLRWARESESEMQLGDVRGVMRFGPPLDLPYLRLWAVRLGVAETLEQLLVETRYEGGW